MPTPFFADLVRELCQQGGTGPLTPTGALPGHRRFADIVPVGTPFHYAILGIAQPAQWEVGLGRIDGSGRLLRDSVAASSHDGEAVDFAPGLKTIALTVGAQWFAAEAATKDALESEMLALSGAMAAKQPLSTTHAPVATGAAGDVLTVRRGSGWVNIPLSTLAFRDADGRHMLDGALGAQSGSAAAPAIGFAGDADTGLFRPDGDAIGLATGGGERVRITPAGRVGIGTTAPAEKLQVNGNVLVGTGQGYQLVNENYGLGGRGLNGLEVHCADGDRIRFGHRSGATFICEAFIGQWLVARAMEEELPLCARGVLLGMRPVVGVDEVILLSPAGAETVLGASEYHLAIGRDGTARLTIPAPGDAVRVRIAYRAGMAEGANGVPEAIRQGIVRMIQHLHDARDGTGEAPPAMIAALWQPWRRMSLGSGR